MLVCQFHYVLVAVRVPSVWAVVMVSSCLALPLKVMDAALLLVAGNETCPQPQTSEHLAAVEIMRLQNIIILQNKVWCKCCDVVSQFPDQSRLSPPFRVR